MVRKILFCSEFPVILEKWWRKEEEASNYEALCFTCKHKNLMKIFPEISLLFFLLSLFYATVQRFELLDHVILSQAKVLGMTLKNAW